MTTFASVFYSYFEIYTEYCFLQVYDALGEFVIGNAFQGYNTSIFTYGPKETGKSWVLFGDSQHQGLIQHCVASIYNKASTYNESTTFRTEIRYGITVERHTPVSLINGPPIY